MDVEDLEGRVLNAIKECGCDLTVLGNYGNLAPGVGTRGRVSLPTAPVADLGAACSTRLEICASCGSTVAIAGNAKGLA